MRLYPSVDKERFAMEEFVKLSLIEQEALLQESFHKEVTEAIPNIIEIAQSKKVSPTIQTLALLLLGANGETTEIQLKSLVLKKW